MAVVVYGLIGLTPMIPKRLFFPITLFSPVALLGTVPLLVYYHAQSQRIAWGISFCQVACGLIVLYCAQGALRFRWPLMADRQLGTRRFGWLNLIGFLLLNAVVLVPVVVGYLAVCVALAVDHFSEGFVALRPGGFTVQVRKYVRDDGKTIQLVPMAHIGEPAFYRALAQSFPTNSILLMEGVTDNQNLLTNKLSYQRMATSLGLAEQQKEFQPTGGKRVRADVDIEQFTKSTIDLLNLAMLVHAKGLDPATLLAFLRYPQPPHVEQQLFDDLLTKRNHRLLEELQARLPQTENIIVPWGAAHMPGIAKEIQKAGFRVKETRDYTVIRFGR